MARSGWKKERSGFLATWQRPPRKADLLISSNGAQCLLSHLTRKIAVRATMRGFP
jgi:hypothetical protein